MFLEAGAHRLFAKWMLWTSPSALKKNSTSGVLQGNFQKFWKQVFFRKTDGRGISKTQQSYNNNGLLWKGES